MSTTTHWPPEQGDSDSPAGTASGLSRRFWALLAAVACSGVGDGMVVVAFPLLASRLTSDPRAIAGVVVAATLPDLAAVVLGAVVDRVDRRRLAASAELARALLLGLFAATVAAGSATLGLLYGVAFLIGLGRTLTETTAQTILPQLVPNSQLGRANGLLFSTETASEHMIGQALGGLAFAAALALPFAVDGITFALSGALLVFAIPAGVRALEGERGESLGRTIADGFHFVKRDRTLRLVTALIIGFAFCQAAATSTLVLYLTGPVGTSEAGFGIVLALVAGGSLIGGLVAGRVDSRFRIDQILLAAGLGSAIAFLVAGATTSVAVVAMALVVEGFLTVVGNVASISLRQRIVPDHLLGRVSGLLRSAIVGAYPLGAIAGGVLASSGELETPLLVAAGLQLLVVALVVRPLVAAIWHDERLAR